MSAPLRFLQSELPPLAAKAARFHLIPAPMENSVSYGHGTAAGPEALLLASDQLELWDGRSVPADEGIYTWPAVDCSGRAIDALRRIGEAVDRALDAGGLPVLLGGEHTVTLGALASFKRRAPDAAGPAFGLVQFDAHADLRDEYEGNRLSHACVMRRALEITGAPLFQIGVRALSVAEHQWRCATDLVRHLDAAALVGRDLSNPLLPADFPEHIYLSIDIDCLDAAVMPATGTPMPGGLGWYNLLACLEQAAAGRTVIGLDLVEFAPVAQLHGATMTAVQLLYATLGIIQRNERRRSNLQK